MQISLTKGQFLELAKRYTVVPLATEVLGDRETPVSVFEALVGDDDGFLLESVEGGERWARWSFVGWDPAFTLIARDGSTEAVGAEIDLPEGDPLQVLESLLARFRTPDGPECAFPGETPPLHGGFVGYLAYDVVRYIEALPEAPPDDRGLPEMVWHVGGGLAAIDRLRDTILIIRNVIVGDDPACAYDKAVADIAGDVERLSRVAAGSLGARPSFDEVAESEANTSRDEYQAAVRRSIEHINAGDAFQIVPSIRFEVEFDGSAFAVYRALRLVNPSPFMYFVRHGSVSIAGSSPELMTRVRNGVAYSRPIAGTRPRGVDPDADAALEVELLADPKERAEHVMLIDLARNDLGRVCEFGTVTVDDLMVIERYSHVMHIVSGVSGTVRGGLGPVDVLRATFPHGTVTGAPKIRAMEIIDDLEPTARGPYAGAVGYIDFAGNLDTAIGLRTMIADGTRAWVQAGAGVVADSDPMSEYRECVNKAAAVLAAIAAAPHLQ
ncbi:MAG: chorismate-binding protein [Actinomycetota bacterium]|nr:chorismate-binding protein [Actinomycetota bacterium]